MKKIIFAYTMLIFFFNMQIVAAADQWTGTWVTGQQLTEQQNLPPTSLANNTLRQILQVSTGGSKLRVKFSNAYGNSPVVLNSVHIAVSTGGSSIDTGTDKALTFNTSASTTIPAGLEVSSDPLDFDLAPLSRLAVTIYFGSISSSTVTGHPGSRTTSYIRSGNSVAAAQFNSASTTDHWYILCGVDLLVDSSYGAIVILGDSITDGRGSTTNGQNRWPDNLARRLQENPAKSKISVLNQGIGGNNVLSGGLGPTARQRFEHDVIEQSGVRWLIILEGVNDIGSSWSQQVATDLISAYSQFIDRAHEKDILVYGVPILPFGGSNYDSGDHETARRTVNDWIRTSGKFDAVIDLDAAVRNPSKPSTLLSAYDTGDHLHLNVAGYQKMADAIDLDLFETSSPAPGGDVNGDGDIDIIDALMIAQHYVGLNPPNFDESAGDVNGDGDVDIIDALRIAQCYVGLVSCNF